VMCGPQSKCGKVSQEMCYHHSSREEKNMVNLMCTARENQKISSSRSGELTLAIHCLKQFLPTLSDLDQQNNSWLPLILHCTVYYQL
jgi:hypothetical protein